MASKWADLIPAKNLDDLVENWLKEDTPSFDYGGYVVGDKKERALLFCKSPGVLCGAPFVDHVFKKLNCQITWKFNEGDYINPAPKTVVAEVCGNANNILIGERVALNCMARCSGIASLARRLQTIKHEHEWKGEVAGTRKTTPGFRLPEKYSLLVGGCSLHRFDLSSMVMLKDNHVWSTGSITKAVQVARNACGFSLKIEVECQTLDEAYEAASAGADVVMLDNFEPSSLSYAANEFKGRFPSVKTEASGGISAANIAAYMKDSVDIISLGALTQGYSVVDFSLKIQPQNSK